MKYALIIHESPDQLARHDGPDAPAYWAAWSAYTENIFKAGVATGGAGLAHPSTATTVTLASDGLQVHDGPFADSKEQLGGFYLIDVPDLDAAIEWASRLPSPGGKIEIRPLLDPSDAG